MWDVRIYLNNEGILTSGMQKNKVPDRDDILGVVADGCYLIVKHRIFQSDACYQIEVNLGTVKNVIVFCLNFFICGLILFKHCFSYVKFDFRKLLFLHNFLLNGLFLRYLTFNMAPTHFWMCQSWPLSGNMHLTEITFVSQLGNVHLLLHLRYHPCQGLCFSACLRSKYPHYLGKSSHLTIWQH